MTRRRRALRVVARIFAVFAVLVTAAAIFGWCALTTRPEGGPGATRDVVIPHGASRDDVVAALERAGLAPHPWLTHLAFKVTRTFGHVRAGAHLVPADAHTLDLIDFFRAASPKDHVVLTLVPGRSIWEHARTLESLGVGPVEDVLTLARDRDFAASLKLPLPGQPPDPARPAATLLEGYLYPETYHLGLREGPREALGRAARQFHKVWGEVRAANAAGHARVTAELGLTDHELVILASLVEKECAARDEAPLIAGVFYNRLRAGWKLETDPTLMYREDRVGRPPTPTERRDASNPYNTYAFKGLPPGPIASPGRYALEAVLAPATTSAMFFVARQDGTGRHVFADDLESHRKNIDTWLRRDR